MLATVLAFGVTLAADLRIQTLERHAAEEAERVARARHEEVLAAIAGATARPVGGNTFRAAGGVRAVGVALAVRLLLRRRQRRAARNGRMVR